MTHGSRCRVHDINWSRAWIKKPTRGPRVEHNHQSYIIHNVFSSWVRVVVCVFFSVLVYTSV